MVPRTQQQKTVTETASMVPPMAPVVPSTVAVVADDYRLRQAS
jgi:hypothetical protein